MTEDNRMVWAGISALIAGFFFGSIRGEYKTENQYQLKKEETRIVQYDVNGDRNLDLIFLRNNKPYDYFLFVENSYIPAKEILQERGANLSELEKVFGE